MKGIMPYVPLPDDVRRQREYYMATANHYEEMHVTGDGEHDIACALIAAFARHFGYRSILDVGSGTGRAVRELSRLLPEANVIGLEPVAAMRAVGHGNGIPEDQLIEGDALALPFPAGHFDLVIELGVLHHLREPRQALAEMVRVTRSGLFLSDSNRFGGGSWLGRRIKLVAWRLGCWPLLNWLYTRGRGYHYSKGDGVAYSYSIFDDYAWLRRHFPKSMICNLDGSGDHALLSAAHVAYFGRRQ